MKKFIKAQNWERKKAFDAFGNITDPYTGVTTTLDVTNLLSFTKYYKVSFYGAMTYLVMKSLNEIDAFHYGYDGHGNERSICQYDGLACSITALDQTNNLNFSEYIPVTNDIFSFLDHFSRAKDQAENQIDRKSNVEVNDYNKVFITCLPWIQFSDFKNAVDLKESTSNPRICWGKYYKEDEGYKINCSLLVHHGFQDGYHIGKFFSLFEQNEKKFIMKKEKDQQSRKIWRYHYERDC